jgi:hypothetical protein
MRARRSSAGYQDSAAHRGGRQTVRPCERDYPHNPSRASRFRARFEPFQRLAADFPGGCDGWACEHSRAESPPGRRSLDRLKSRTVERGKLNLTAGRSRPHHPSRASHFRARFERFQSLAADFLGGCDGWAGERGQAESLPGRRSPKRLKSRMVERGKLNLTDGRSRPHHPSRASRFRARFEPFQSLAADFRAAATAGPANAAKPRACQTGARSIG